MKLHTYVLAVLLTFSWAPAFAANTPTPNQIIIHEYKFAPTTLNITAGTKVTWVNHDEVPHTIVDSAVPKTFYSAALDTKDSYSYVFTTPGTYRYFCTLHPQMVGTVIVSAAK